MPVCRYPSYSMFSIVNLRLLLFFSTKLFQRRCVKVKHCKQHGILVIKCPLRNKLKTMVSFLTQRCWSLVDYMIADNEHH